MARLAIDGGEPIRTGPFPPRIQMDQRELEAVVNLIKASASGAITLDRYGGEQVDSYEREFAGYFGTPFATAVSSGTAAIHSALAALRLDVGSEVISAPITDPGAVAPILMSNCVPIFADADPDTFNMTPESIAERISARTRAIIVGHIAGQPCDMDPIMAIAEAHKLVVIEDCSQAHDALYKGRKVGTIGHIGTFSLMSGKHSTAGGQGGMVITHNEEYYWNAKRFADRGKPFNSDSPGIMLLGLNYRMTELEAAIGRVQLHKLSDIVGRRRAFVAALKEGMADLQTIHLGKEIEGVEPAYWFLFIKVEQDRLGVSKDQVAAALQAEGLPVNAAYDHLIPEQPWIRNRQTYGQCQCPWSCSHYGRTIDYEGTCPNARKAIADHMMLPIHECLTEREVGDLVAGFRKVEESYWKG